MRILFYFYYNEAGAPGKGLPKNKACQTAVRNGKFRKAKRHVLDGETARFARQNGTFRNSTDYQALTQGVHTAGNGTKTKAPTAAPRHAWKVKRPARHHTAAQYPRPCYHPE